MGDALKETNFQLPGQTHFYRGKVRDVYYLDKQVLMITTDRISAFDVILPRPIPFKGQVLNQIAFNFLVATSDIVPNWVTSMPDPNVMIGFRCEPYPIEMVIRGYLAGHAWREYKAGRRLLCGVALPEGLRENDPLPEPIITPATKSQEGHDEDISREEIIARKIVPEDEYQQLEEYTRKLFDQGSRIARDRGLILVDTKYEFGKFEDRIHLIDEVHTPDSSRYFYAEGYQERQKKGETQKQLSKEFVRQWLISEGFQGQDGQPMPVMTDEVVQNISNRYIELYEKLINRSFIREKSDSILHRIEKNIMNTL
ncbi:MAG: phosphoribosylaminoimidazolesuccinocarboxamide synthase [Cyclobacteriaceae bacterium]|jgi:phosphoribosylaminoimidazole-succinocarboxamide synthase